MARYRGQKSLFEVIGGRAEKKLARPAVEPLKPEKPQLAKPVIKKTPFKVQVKSEVKAPLPEKEVISWTPKPVQCHNGRIEITVSTRTGLIMIMVMVVGFLACFKAGQLYPGLQSGTFIENKNNVSPERSWLPSLSLTKTNVRSQAESTISPVPVKQASPTPQPAVKPAMLATTGNAIVIQEFTRSADLFAVGRFFSRQGVKTEVVRKGSTFFLLTQARFPYNPEAANTRGRVLLEEIRLIGQEYKAPKGLESFAPNKFKGAYGRNIDDQYIGEVTDVH